MDRDVHLPGPAAELVRVAESVTAEWLRRIVVDAARAGGADPSDLAGALDDLVAAETPRLLDALRRLLATDVDEQRTNPLSLYRAAVTGPNELLRDAGIPAPARDDFAEAAFPDDVYGLGPATWADIHPDLREAGVTWGAWKAMTVLRRRRAGGQR